MTLFVLTTSRCTVMEPEIEPLALPELVKVEPVFGGLVQVAAVPQRDGARCVRG